MTEKSEAVHDSKGMMAAIVKTALEAPELDKTQKNAHGGYNFAGIDDFYREVAKVALANGLTWMVRETAYEARPDIGKHGSAQATYSVDMAHAPTGTLWENIFSATVMHPMAGAQTSGSALSYVDKMFMRQLFKVVTGEPDADSTDNTPAAQVATQDAFGGFGDTSPPKFVEPPAKAPEPAKPDTKYDAEWVDLFMKMVADNLPLASNQTDLADYWTSNTQALDKLKAMSIDAYNDLISKFKARKAELIKEGF